MKYNLSKIKKLRLEGKTLEEIGDYFGVHKSTISIHLKRKYGISFWQLPKRCRCCNKVFEPKKPNHQFCSKACWYIYTLKRTSRNERRYYYNNVDENFGYVYEIKNVVNNKRYIGATKNIRFRFRQHKTSLNSGEHHSKTLQDDFNKYGLENFIFKVLAKVPEEDLDFMEKYFIECFDVMNPKYGYNKNSGGYKTISTN